MSGSKLQRVSLLGVFAASTLACATAGAGDPTSGVAEYTVVDLYRRTFRFDLPVPVELFVDYRAISFEGKVAEYGVTVGGRDLLLLYSIIPGDELPLRTEVFDRRSLEPLVVARADDQDLVVANRDDVVLAVQDYLTPERSEVTANGEPVPDEALRALQAVLPARGELGLVPQFFLNRADAGQVAGTDGIAHTTSVPRPILADWEATESLLGAFVKQSVCTRNDRSARYQCPCFRLALPDGTSTEGGHCE